LPAEASEGGVRRNGDAENTGVVIRIAATGGRILAARPQKLAGVRQRLSYRVSGQTGTTFNRAQREKRRRHILEESPSRRRDERRAVGDGKELSWGSSATQKLVLGGGEKR